MDNQNPLNNLNNQDPAPNPSPAPMPDQTVATSPTPVTPFAAPVTSSPEPAFSAPAPEPASFNSVNLDSSTSSGLMSDKYGLASVGAGLLVLILVIILIFAGGGLVSSMTKLYIWFGVFLALGVAGLVSGILSAKNSLKISIPALIGIILSVMVCINCILIGAYYIKANMVLNSIQEQYESSSSSTSY